MAFRLHTCQFDKDGNVWIASSPGGMIQKYTHDGSKLLQQIGKTGVFDTSDGTTKGTPLNSNAAKMGNLKKTFDNPWKPVTAPADGKIKESGGATVALALSRDPAQTFMFVVNQNNSRIDIVERQTGKILSSLGEIGNLPGQFNQAHSVAVDSQNNLYVVENRGRRIHKFKPVSQ